MSEAEEARRADVQIVFEGSEHMITMNKDWISFTYVDNEEDDADDFQLKTHDYEGTWLRKFLSSYIDDQAAAGEIISSPDEAAKRSGLSGSSGSSGGGHNVYKVTSSKGLNVRTGAGEKFKILGKLAYGDCIEVKSISGGWAKITYSGKTAYVKGENLAVVGSSGSGSASNASSSSYTSGTAVFGSEDRKISKGVKISAAIVLKNGNSDGKDEVLDCGVFELDSVDMQGPPSTLTIKGTSLSYSSTIRQTLKSKSWENTTLSQIAGSIAGANGMAVMFESSNNPKYTRMEQYCMSDIAFLQRLCRDAGCSLKATNNILVIFDQAEYEHKSPVRTIEFGAEGGYTKYKLSTGENSHYTSCRVYYTTTSGAVISATEYSENYRENSDSGQCLEVRRNVSNAAEAQRLAHKLLRLHNKFENEATFTFPGDPGLAAGCTVKLADFGMWDGIYIIKQARHTVSSSGYTTQITLRKALEVSVESSLLSGAGADDAAIDEIAKQVIRGDWGNGQERRERLTAAGYDYGKVQARVNKILYG